MPRKPAVVASEPERIPREEVTRLRAAAPAPPKTLKRVFYLDSPLGEVEVTVKGPAGAAKLQATHDSLVISTGAEELPVVGAAPRRAERVAPPRRVVNADPSEPDGVSVGEPVDSLPGDDNAAERKARELEAETFDFLRKGERALMRRTE